MAPAVAHADDAPTTMNNKTLFVTGLVAEGLGASAMTIGGVMAVLGAMIPQSIPAIDCASPCPPFHPPPNPLLVAGATLLGIGGATVVAGIPMIVIGAKRVAVEPTVGGMSLRMTF